jgi:hypothetical protein
MNKIQQIFKYALIIGAMAAFTTACSDDDTTANFLPSVIKVKGDYEQIFSYDTQNRIIGITENSGSGKTPRESTITYNGDKVSEIVTNEGTYHITYYVTYEGNVVYLNIDPKKGKDGAAFVYTLENGLLMNIEQNSGVVKTYVYDNKKNLTILTALYNKGVVDFVYNYTYDTTKSGIFINSATPNWVMVFLDLDDLHSPNLISSNKRTFYTNNYSEELTYNWSDYKNGFPTKRTVTLDGNETTTATISYISKK